MSFTTFSARKERGCSPFHFSAASFTGGMLRERGSPSFRKENSRKIFPKRGGFATVIRWFLTFQTEKNTKLLISLPERLRAEPARLRITQQTPVIRPCPSAPPTHACTLTRTPSGWLSVANALKPEMSPGQQICALKFILHWLPHHLLQTFLPVAVGAAGCFPQIPPLPSQQGFSAPLLCPAS